MDKLLILEYTNYKKIIFIWSAYELYHIELIHYFLIIPLIDKPVDGE